MLPDPQRWPDRMTATDAIFWSLGRVEGFRCTVGALVLLDGPPRDNDLKVTLEDLAHRMPRMRQQVIEVPLDAAPPEWARDERFDLSAHIHSIRPRPPRDLSALFRALRKRTGTPMDPTRPLWRAYSADGLAKDRGAVFIEMHHCMTEGLGISRLLEGLAILGNTELQTRRASLTPRLVSPDALLWRATQYNLEGTWDAAQLAATTVNDVVTAPVDTALTVEKAVRTVVNAVIDATFPASGAATRHARHRSRCFAMGELSIDELARVCHQLHATELEVLLALLASALREMHAEAGRPRSEIDVIAPMRLDATRAEPDDVESIVACTVPVDDGGVLEQLEAVRSALRSTRAKQRLRWYSVLARLTNSLPTAIAGAIGREQSRHGDVVHLGRASGHPERFAGRSVEAVIPFGPVVGAPPVVLASYRVGATLLLGFDLDAGMADHLEDFDGALQGAWDGLQLRAAQRRLAG